MPIPPIPGIHVATGRFRPAVPVNGEDAALRLGTWLQATVHSRHPRAHTEAVHASGVRVLFEGYLTATTENDPAPHAPAATLLAHYLESRLDCLPRLRGSYTCLILDGPANRAHLFNDRRASRPVFYRDDGAHGLLVGPEVSPLACAEPALQAIDPVAVCEFVLFASYYNDRTLFPGIRKLPPGTVMSLGPDGVTVRRYWEIRVDPDKPPVDARAATEEAVALFDQSIRRSLAGAERPFLFLSGGLDSRMILGGLRTAGLHIPAVTYGTAEGDDAPIARQLAEHCGLPFDFHPIATDDPQRLFADAAVRSDCRAETVDTPTHGPLLDQLAGRFARFVQGDKSFYGKDATTPAQALRAIGVYSFAEAPRLGDMLEPGILRQAQAAIDGTRSDLVAACAGLDPQDIKDKLYFEQRLANRQNAFTAVNLRQFEQARPWLDEDLVDFLFSLPGSLRRDKQFNRGMLELAHPDLLQIPFASRDSIPQPRAYRQDIPAKPALAAFIRAEFDDLLDARLAGLFRPGSLAALVDSLARGSALPQPKTRWWQHLPGTWRFTAARYQADRLHPVSLIFRLMQINLYLRAMNRHDAPPSTEP